MTVLHVVESFGGGVIGFVAQLTRHLPQHRHIVVHAIREGEVDPEITRKRFPEGVEFVLWPGAVREVSALGDLRALRSLITILKTLPHDAAIHLHSSKAGFLGRLACLWLGRPNVLYSPNAAAFLRKDIGPLKKAFFSLFEMVGARFAGRVVACSDSEAAAFNNLKIATLTINNGTDIGGLPPAIPAELPLSIITTGRTTVQKDPAMFNRIATALASDDRFRFIWAGSGEMDAELNSPNTTLTGWIPATRLKELLRTAHVYLSTSAWEGLSFAVLEAMAEGLPLVLRDCVGNVDQVESGPKSNGHIFHNEEEAIAYLLKLADEPSQLAALGRHSYQLASKKFDIREVASRFEALYLRQGRF